MHSPFWIKINYLVVRWQDGLSTQWWRRLKSGNGKKDVVLCTWLFSVVSFTFFQQLLWLQIGHRVICLLTKAIHIFLITYLCLTHFYMLFCLAGVTDLSDGDYVYLHCSSYRGRMGWGWALVNLVVFPVCTLPFHILC